MSEVSLALQGAIVTTLRASPAVTAIVGTRTLDRVELGTSLPYVTVGEDQVIPERADCYTGAEVYLTLHAWSEKPGFVEVKRLAGAIVDALDGAALVLADFRAVDLAHDGTRFLRDPDGLTSHAVITFRALVEPV